MPALFALTLFVSAALLFLIQPLLARELLPRLGGAPAVWNTCLVFFQAALLAGYSYAHALASRLDFRRQAALHLGLLALALVSVFLLLTPVGPLRRWSPPEVGTPVPWLLGLLAYSIGAPFVLMSASAPLLQRWFSASGRPGSRDPYPLYAASNLGSLAALLAYPALLEPFLPLTRQFQAWVAGYFVLFALIGLCACSARPSAAAAPRVTPKKEAAPMTRQLLTWLALAFVPSSLLLGVTTYLSTDLAPVPLLWVVPLALYLVSFILAFAGLPGSVSVGLRVLLPGLVVLHLCQVLAGAEWMITTQVGVHLLTFFVVALVAHAALAESRPAAARLTEFYLWLSAGGVLGGLFNALLAPVLFRSVVEYPLALVLSCLLVPRWRLFAEKPWSRWFDVLLPAVLAAFTTLVLVLGEVGRERPGATIDPGSSPTAVTATASGGGVPRYLPGLLCLALATRPLRFALGVAAVLLAHAGFQLSQDNVLLRERTFFSVLRLEARYTSGVKLDATGRAEATGGSHRLYHGTTLHGAQRLDVLRRPFRRSPPMTYYHPTGPIGQVFDELHAAHDDRPVALVGLGAGSLAYYGRPGQVLDFYEIDSAVERVARDDRYFTFLSDAEERGVRLSVILGDGRLSLGKAPSPFGLIVVDAFSSDAVPVHLVTREAIRLYLDELAPDGLLAFHISNRYLDLAPVLANLAEDAGLAGLIQTDQASAAVGKSGSIWVVLARRPSPLGAAAAVALMAGLPERLGALAVLRPSPFFVLGQDERWRRQRLTPRRDLRVWTDDYSSLLGIFRWSALTPSE